ncbi:MAG: MFS transporter [Chloroflexi bacterium]|nr:MFS transporter [Chloroflexota bacterium]
MLQSKTAPAVMDPGHRWKIITAALLAASMSATNASILYVSYPKIASAFHTNASTVLWLTVGPQVLMVGLLFTLGRLGDLYGRGRVLASGFTLFLVALTGSVFAPNILTLIAAQVVQGIGHGIMNANSMATISTAFPEEERGKAIGIWALVTGLFLSAGPFLGGLLVDSLGWQSLFYVRIPWTLLGLALALNVRRLPALMPRTPGRRLVFDTPGAILLLFVLGCALLGVNRMQAWGVTSPAILALLASSAALFPVFLQVERRSLSPVISLAMFRDRTLSAAFLILILMYTVYATFNLLTPFYLVDGRGYSSLHAGLLMMAFPIGFTLASPFSGYLTDRMNPFFLIVVGAATMFAGLMGFRLLGEGSSASAILWPIALLGVGHGLFDTASAATLMKSLPAERIGTANASVTTGRQMGIAIGLAGAGAVFAAREARHTRILVDQGIPAVEAASRGLIGGVHDAVWLGIGCALVALAIALGASRFLHKRRAIIQR